MLNAIDNQTYQGYVLHYAEEKSLPSTLILDAFVYKNALPSLYSLGSKPIVDVLKYAIDRMSFQFLMDKLSNNSCVQALMMPVLNVQVDRTQLVTKYLAIDEIKALCVDLSALSLMITANSKLRVLSFKGLFNVNNVQFAGISNALMHNSTITSFRISFIKVVSDFNVIEAFKSVADVLSTNNSLRNFDIVLDQDMHAQSRIDLSEIIPLFRNAITRDASSLVNLKLCYTYYDSQSGIKIIDNSLMVDDEISRSLAVHDQNLRM